MPTNLLKIYPQLLEIDHLNETQRIVSLKGIFKRDIEDNPDFNFRTKKINPIKKEEDAMHILFHHLTTKIVDKKTNLREFESQRSKRLHWIKYHLDENKKDNILIFSVEDPEGIRTYIFDEYQKYVIILEPYRSQQEYYLLTAYYLEGRNPEKIKQKYKRRLPHII
ncbi:MAG: hypothetical protein ACYC6P_09160 [Ignavibacteriaceae bacterium]